VLKDFIVFKRLKDTPSFFEDIGFKLLRSQTTINDEIVKQVYGNMLKYMSKRRKILMFPHSIKDKKARCFPNIIVGVLALVGLFCFAKVKPTIDVIRKFFIDDETKDIAFIIAQELFELSKFYTSDNEDEVITQMKVFSALIKEGS